MIVIWKNFTKGMLDAYKDEKFVADVFTNDTYFFLTNSSNYIKIELPLQEALKNLDQLYLGFSYTLLNRNPRLWMDFNTMLASWGPSLQKMIPVNKSLHHAFLYKGMDFHTGIHQAPVSDWFVQIANAKRWRFIHPR